MSRFRILVCLLVSSCVLNCNRHFMSDSLTGRTYVDEISKNQITFTDKQTFLVESNIYNEDFRTEVAYSISGDEEIIFTLTSAEVALFPYNELKFEKSRNVIAAYDMKHNKRIFLFRENY